MSKLKSYIKLINILDDALSNRGCNDFEVDNTIEMYYLIEQANADNYRLSVEDWKNHEDYYKPNISKCGTKIYTQDYMIFSIMKKELGLNND